MDVRVRYPGESEGLNNWIARETTRVPVSRYSKLHLAVHEVSSAASAASSRSCSPFGSENGRDLGRKPSEKFGFYRWPLLKSKSSRTDVRSVFHGAKESQATLVTPHESGSTSRLLASRESAKPKLPDFPGPPPRKISVPDLTLKHMTTVYEGLLDSPTLPLHHPFLERSLSYPEFGLRRLSEDASEKTPKVTDFPKLEIRQPPATSEVRTSWERRGRRRSSVVMQKELMPLIIPSVSPVRSLMAECMTATPDGQDETPPEVPPKSPRTESRASPRPKQTAHSASSSTSTLHSLSSCATSVSSVSGKSSPQPFQHSHRSESPVPSRCGRNLSDGQSSGLSPKIGELLERKPLPRAESPLIPPSASPTPRASVYQEELQGQTQSMAQSSPRDREVVPNSNRNITHRSQASRGQIESPLRASRREKLVTANLSSAHGASGHPLWHQRGVSEASGLNRGRSVVRGDTPVVQILNRTALRAPSLSEEKCTLPTGFRVAEISGKLLDSDFKVLKKQADERITAFEVLSVKDVSSLSKELNLLNERCEYLHRTHTSLRQGRNGLHSRMILYLKTPQLTIFSRESILKQEEALAELDCSIDAWVSKLERAEDRRNRIQEKLLQHFAAASKLPMTSLAQPAQTTAITLTPPTSPENSGDVYSRDRRDVQSIKVYADSGVAASLSAIEQDLDLADPSNFPS